MSGALHPFLGKIQFPFVHIVSQNLQNYFFILFIVKIKFIFTTSFDCSFFIKRLNSIKKNFEGALKIRYLIWDYGQVNAHLHGSITMHLDAHTIQYHSSYIHVQ